MAQVQAEVRTNRSEDAVQAGLDEAQLRTILETTPVVVYVKDTAYRYLFTNREFDEMFGLKPGEMLGHTDEAILPPPVVAQVRRHDRKVLEEGVALQEEEVVPRDGEDRTYVSTKFPLGDEGGQVYAVCGISTDVTAQRRANELERRLLSIVEHSDDAIFGNTPQGVITSWNAGAERLYGYSSTEIVGKSVATLVPSERSAEAQKILDRLTAGKVVERFETEGVRKDGSRVPVSLTVSPIKDSDGGIVGAATIARDITERRRAHPELKAAKAELERSNADLEQFAYAASHDLAEPLRAISGFSRLLADRYRGELDADAQRYLGHIVDGAERMKTLIDALLRYSRVGRMQPQLAPVDSAAAVTRVLEVLAGPIEARGARVSVAPLPTVVADEQQLEQVFQNLVSNALKFSSDAPEVRISAERDDGSWRFCVADNGIGVEPEYAERIFQMFERLYTRDHYEGSGIGLALCAKVIDRHGGRIWVESNGAGSSFFFTLPDREETTA